MSSAEIRRVEEILTSEYSTEKYVELLKEIFDDIQLVAPDKHRKEYSNYSSHIEGYCHIGFYNAPENKKVILYAVRLKSLGYVEHSRSTQRSYVKALIENSGSDAAIVAFYSERDAKWRLSFVRLDYEAQMQNGKVKLAQNMTPAKRYSFLVGKDEPCHTAVERFRSFLEGNTANPSLDDLEEAFSVEAVTKEFFNLYCEKFKQLLIHLEDSEEFMAEATAHNFTAAQFAKKLMGQIVFLYFLQKKGWLGVNAWPKRISEKEYKDAYYRFGKKTKELIPVVYLPAGDGTYVISGAGLNRISDEDEAVLARSVKGEPWGTGPRNFMRKLFETAAKKNLNFFDNYLEPLFYNALNRNRGEQGYDPNLHCRIPFLSGGLFEPLAGYDWEHSEFSIPNEVFSNRQNNNSRTGDGILDVFDRYNFTMSEDEPLEREVAIDPEMLGKVFENLLEVRDRKAKGAFYTPREIVHYMCQESLIAYLKESLQTDEASVRDFILYGDFMKDSDTVNKRNIQQSNLMISEQLFKVDGNGKVVVNRLMEMDEALREIRVADPAVGSGAFPLGMLNEIVRARQNISAYMAIGKNPNQIRMMYALERAPYALKRDTIRNCIFAADIDPSAVDIARLRLWLSLVIDDEINPTATDELDGHRNPLPLPNLECNIICGNSLIDEFEGIKLINQSELIGTAAEGQTNLGIGVFEPILKKLIATQEELFKCDNTDTKKQLLEQIDSLKDRIIRSQLEGAAPEIIEHYEDSKMAPSKPYLLWQLEFAKVFKEKGGFDVVIGNPPYVSTKGIDEKDKRVLENIYGYADDLYHHFIEKSMRMVRQSGIVTMITPDTYYTTVTKARLRQLLLEYQIRKLVQLGHDIFDSAMVSTAIIIVQCKRIANKNELQCVDVKNRKSIYEAAVYECEQSCYKKSINEAFYIPTPFNEALISVLGNIHNDLLQKYMPMIKTATDISKNAAEIKVYRNGLKAGDWTIIGLVTDGGQGLATANNGRFVGVRENTKEADRIAVTRMAKLAEFNVKNNCNYQIPDKEEALWELFEDIKAKHGRDVFGQGYLYRIVPKAYICELSSLSDEEKENGIDGMATYVPYDKGDKDGNRWYYETPYLIDWSREKVAFLKRNSGKKGKGMPVVRNANFYFREGFCYNDIKTFFLKCKMKGVSIHDVKSMSFFPVCDNVPYYYLITLLNTEVVATFVYNFLNNTPSFQINDCRMVPIKVPSEEELATCWDLFNEAVDIQKSFFGKSIDSEARDKELTEVQKRIDKWACKIYGIPESMLVGTENYVR